MKKFIILVLSLSSLFAAPLSIDNNNFELISKSDVIKIAFDLGDIQFEAADDFTNIISASKGETSIIGMPKLPSFSSMVMLDPEKTYSATFKVLSSYSIENINIIPNQRIVNGLETKEIDDIDINFYQSNGAYPFNNVVLSDPMIMRDLVLSSLEVVPFIYHPDTQELEVFENIEISIYETGITSDIRRREMPRSKVFENIYARSIINYDINTRDGEYQQPSVLYIGSSSVLNNSTFEQLLQWRRERGYVVYTATTSQTGSTASSIKNYIDDAYDDFDPPPEYVTLIGDVGGSYSLPTYYEDFGHDSYGSQCEGDHPYSQLDGNDLLPEVLLGRMSLRSSSEISTVVYKILNYEKATYLDNYIDYYGKAAMAGDPSSSGNSCAITKEVIKETLEAHGIADVDIKTSGSGWSTWMQNELSDGVLFFNYRGYLGMSGFSTSNVDNASSGWKLPFATILTCGTGSFAEDQTAMSEKFFRAGSVTNPKGGVAAIGTATWNTHTLFNNIVDMGIYDGLLADNVETAGAALVSGKFALYNTYPGDPYEWISAFTQWNNLMGDGPTHIWTNTPEVIEVVHSNTIPYGTNFLDIQVFDDRDNPLGDAMVSVLYENNDIAEILYSDANGMVTLDLDPSLTNSMTITVTKQDCKPYQGTASIYNPDVNVNFDYDSDIIVNDDNDGIPASGETFELSIPLVNYGSQNADDVVAILTSTSSDVTIENPSVSYGNISSGNYAYPQENFIIHVASSVVQSEDLALRLNISDSQFNQWESSIPLDVIGSLLQITSIGYVEPGETTTINIQLTNAGSVAASSVTGELSFNGSQVQINDASGSWGSLLSGESSNSSNGFNVTLSNDLVSGSQLILSLHLQSAEGYDRTELFALIAGNVSVSDPMGPDQYGYYIYDSGDDGFDLSPDYDWIDISSFGTNLSLSNSGNGNWSGNGPLAYVNLPFDFKFYGLSYNQITVCTNGWISLGASSAASFRNYPIPGAGGPSPMIAAFWDDLETGSSGDVFVYSTNDYVIVQWDNMRTNWGDDYNTFQVILYNETAPPYSDNNIKIQYQDFNNTSSGSFTSYPPIHGSYATIGIENHLADDGLQYSYYNNYPSPAMTLSDGTALYITTQAPISLPVPDLNYTIDNTDLEVEIGGMTSSELVITNNGEEGSLLTYSVTKSYPDVSSPFDDVTGGGPDSYGYFWSDSDINNNIDYEWIDISTDGIPVTFNSNDSGTENLDIGFDFPFYGESYTEFIINANGWIGFGEDSDAWYNGNIPSTDAPTNAIFGFWDDLNPVNDNCNDSCTGNVYYHSSNEQLVVTFDNVAHWASGGFEDSFYTFQIVIYPNGEVDININSLIGNYSATVGMQNASGTIALQVDEYNGSYFNDNMSFNFARPFIPSDWLSILTISGLSGELNYNEYAVFTLEANASNLIVGEYLADVLISTNSSDTEQIPIILSVLDTMGVLGDANGDGDINVSDIVILVNIIVNGSDYISNGDINQDELIDVIDVVLLVSMILNN